MKKIRIVTKTGVLPTYETRGSAGMDLRSTVNHQLLPGKRCLIPTGIFIELPEGYEAQVRARSGFAVKHGIGLVNGVGTIDSDYRGEIQVCLINWGEESFEIKQGDRIAQLIISQYERIEWEEVAALEDTERGAGGFGSSGK
ncbi:MAG: dUTP diphosphatase [Clostridia bacterium]|jgi:dUTP pyrophosphatase|nr:dUTP diphosphatase [Clostridia bacterium]HPD90055.1 dUTP diphosphatase [Bacillota bacterium]